MPASEPSNRRRIPVRLADVPLELRLKAMHAELRNARTARERTDLLAAAVAPKETTFYVTDVLPLQSAA